ncbi:hypothetical protein pb186bvf_010717 [Paramecium bursaria]
MQKDQPQKIVMLGEGRVGKTSLTIRFCKDQFDDAQESSINATCLEKVVALEQKQPIKLAIWDTAGQEIFHAMQPMYYRDAMGAVLVYDVTYKESFMKVEKWIEELKQFGKPDIEIVIAGNKCDMKNSIQIDQKEVEEYAKKVGAKHFLTSAKANIGIDLLFKSLANSISNKLEQNQGQKKPKKGLTIRDSSKDEKANNKKGGDQKRKQIRITLEDQLEQQLEFQEYDKNQDQVQFKE